MTMQLAKKADLASLKGLHVQILQMQEKLDGLGSQFADREENEKDHKLLQKNLKNLYDLFLSFKGEQGEEDDPMFTTKKLGCASCAKSIQNMGGFRAEHTAW